MRKLILLVLSPLKLVYQKLLQGKLMRMLQSVFVLLIRNGFKIALLSVAMIFVLKSDIDLKFQFNSRDIIPNSAEQFSFGKTLGGFLDFDKNASPKSTTPARPATQGTQTDWGNTYSNMTYDNRNNTTLKREKQLAYVKRFKDVARSEMYKYGIPASITLAQGLIESNAGESRLSRENNNHFGMKCFSKSCRKGHCSNFTDDSHKDFFRKYKTSWESYRAHSLLLTGKRYRGLRQHGKDYKKWAQGLKKAGYATDRRYAQKLIHIIEELKLQQFDQ